MTIRVEAIYEDGILYPVEPISFADKKRVNLTIEPQIGKHTARCDAGPTREGGLPRSIEEREDR